MTNKLIWIHRTYLAALFLVYALPIQSAEIIAVNYPPMMIEAGSSPGFSIEIIREAERRIGVQSEITFLPFQRAIKTVKRRPEKIHPALYRNEQRENSYTWIVKYMTVNDVFLSTKKQVNSLDDARKLARIGVEAGTAMDIYLTSLGFVNLERAERAEINARKLERGRIDAWALTDILAKWAWKNAIGSNELIVGNPVKSQDVYFVAGKNFPDELAAKYRKAVKDMISENIVNMIISRYE